MSPVQCGLCVVVLYLCCGGTEAGSDMLGTSYFHLVLKVNYYILPFLNYSTMMLEPHLDMAGMEAHYEGHHENYRRHMNDLLALWRKEEADSEFARESILTILQNIDQVPEKYRRKMGHYGGGYVNHCFYFGVISPNMESEVREPTGDIADEIQATFGGFREFQERVHEAVDEVYGSGYVWLVRNPDGGLEIQTTANEDSPIFRGFSPILILDLWEHAYQTKHTFKRQDYVRDWWNVVDWDKVSKLDQWWKDMKTKAEEASSDRDEL